ncbi:MAG: ABC transporter permease [Pseudomonadales bacterium]|nr:ABC transporter permease [Pseudomonadales bacterium]
MNVWFDLSFTLRLLRRKAGFTSLCVFVIAVGLAMAVPLLVLTKFTGTANLPFPDSDRLTIIMEDTQISSLVPTSQTLDPYVYQLLTESLSSFEMLGAYQNSTSTISDGETAEIVSSAVITSNLLDVANTNPILGRSLVANDNQAGASPVAVVSYSLWNSYYNRDENIIGKQSRVDGQTYTIVGVMPEGFAYPYLNDIWLPLQLPANPEPSGNQSLLVVGMLNEGINLTQADTEVKAILTPLSEEYPESYGDKTGIALHYTKIFNSSVVPFTGVLLSGLTAAVLLLVAFNVGNLLIIRSNERIAELAVRSAVGGTRLRITGQVLLESLLIVGGAICIGLVLGQTGLTYLSVAYPEYFAGFPFWFSVNLGLEDSILVVLCAIAVWLFSSLYPAWQASRSSVGEVLNRNNQSTSGAGSFTRFLVAMELVASCFLLIVSLALAVSIYNAYQNELGIQTDDILASRLRLSSDNYQTAEEKLHFLQQLDLEVANQDSFGATEFTTAPPRVHAPSVNYQLQDRDLRNEGQFPSIKHVWTSDGYLEQLGIELVEGRFFDVGDNHENLPAVIVDELFAQQFWPEDTALGKQIIYDADRSAETLTVVGVVRFLLQGNPIGSPLSESTLYRPLSQLALAGDEIQSSVNTIFTTTTASGLTTSSRPISFYEDVIKQASARVDRDVAILNVLPLIDMTLLSGAPFNLFADLMTWVSIVTALLAIAGIYGVVSRSVILRTKELNIRRAVGSTNQMILNLFLSQASRYLLASFVVGGVGAVLLLSILVEQIQSAGLFNVVFPVATSVLAGLACLVLLASVVPVRKIVAMDPAEALYCE